MLDLYKLHHFVALAGTLNYTQAADDVGLSQSALTRSIQSLERSVGMRLFDRSRTGVTLSSAGTAILPLATELLARSQTVKDSITALQKGTSGRVSFGMGPVAAACLLPYLVAAVKAETSDISLDIRSETPETMEQMLLTGEIDFYLARLPMNAVSPVIEVEWLNKTVPTAVVRRGHPLANQAELDPFDIARFPRAAAHGFREVVSLIPDTARRACYEPVVVYDGLSGLYDIARRSDLIVFSSFHVDDDDLRAISLSREDAEHMESRVGIFRMEGRTLSPAVLRVQSMIQQRYNALR